MYVYGGGVAKWLEVGGEWTAEDFTSGYLNICKMQLCVCVGRGVGGLAKWLEVGGEWDTENCLWLFKHLQNARVFGGRGD